MSKRELFKPGNIIKHDNNTDIAFEIMGAMPRKDGIKLAGQWINIISSTPYVMGTDFFVIKESDFKKWNKWLPKELH